MRPLLAAAAFVVCAPALAEASLVTYSAPPGTTASPHYRVTLDQGPQRVTPFVHVSEAQLPAFNRNRTTSFASFSMSGRVRVRVERSAGGFRRCAVLPSSYAIPCRRVGDAAEFTLERPRKVAIEFDGETLHPLLLFADPLETDAPSPSDPDVVYFGPGRHDLAAPLEPRPGQTVYLAGGAIVSGLIRAEHAPNVTIRGRGILVGRAFGHTRGRHIFFGNQSAGVTVRDIIIVDSPGFMVTLQGPRSRVSNVKGLGWWFNTDGAVTGEDGVIEDCFFKCNDDAIKLYRSGARVERTTIWQMENGAPFQISWNTDRDVAGVVVKNCDVIHVDHAWDNPNEAVFDAIHGGAGHLRDYLFEDVRIENAAWRLVSLQIRPNVTARAASRGSLAGLVFRNITVSTRAAAPLRRLSVIQGETAAASISDVVFEGLRVNGRLVRDARDGGFEIDPTTTRNIRFVATGTDAPPQAGVPPPTRWGWTNPIRDGLNSYGVKDVHILPDGGRYYLVGTEQPNPEWGKRGLVLYASDDMASWREQRMLFNRNGVPKEAWYRDEWSSPEIHRLRGRYYLLFSARNDAIRPYDTPGIGIAVADRVDGPYTLLTPERPLERGRHATLVEDDHGRVFLYFDLDGRIRAGQIDPERAAWVSRPDEVLGPAQLGPAFRFLDAPFVTRNRGGYVMIASSFWAGYIVRVRQYAAPSPLGPWRLAFDEPITTWIESEADTTPRMPYSRGFTFAPPTQVVFSHQLFAGPAKRLFVAYHSSEKYAEPALVIEPAAFDATGRLAFERHKQASQTGGPR